MTLYGIRVLTLPSRRLALPTHFPASVHSVSGIVLCGLAVLCLCAPLPAAGQAPPKLFATSVVGTADLSSWPDANGEIGLAAADRICHERAQVAGLQNPTQFVAWISDSFDDAYCRLHGLSGKKSANCGAPTLPVAAGPWVRTDGALWSGSLDEIFSLQKVYRPILLDEHGAPIPDRGHFTHTDAAGAVRVPENTCADWQSASDPNLTITGSSFVTAVGWSLGGAATCGSNLRLLCMEKGVSPPLTPVREPGALAFVSEASGTGDLGSWPGSGGFTGLEAGDTICQTEAAQQGLKYPDSFKAWLSAGTVSAVTRFTHDGPWVRRDGLKIAENLADLTDGRLENPLNLTSSGLYLGNQGVWTGTDDDGTFTLVDCAGWASPANGVNGRVGSAYTVLGMWTSFFPTPCNASSGGIYCFADIEPVVFTDGFESGDTMAWDLAVP